MSIKLSMILLLMGTAAYGFACEYHGGQNFSAFGQFHPLAKQRVLISEQPALTVAHDSDMSVKTGAETNVQFRYSVPHHYSQATVTLIASEDLTIANSSPLSIAKLWGTFNVSFRTVSAGEHFILVRVDATQNDKPYSKIQRISVSSS